MPDTYALSQRLLPELTDQLARTRKVLAAIPEGHNDFKSAEKSMPLTRLAGHTAEFAGIAANILMHSTIDAGGPTDPRKILRMTTVPALLTDFDQLVTQAVAALEQTSDAAFDDPWTLTNKGVVRFSGTRYDAYRTVALDHMLHHRGQLTVYLRLLGAPVPATFGPSADESV